MISILNLLENRKILKFIFHNCFKFDQENIGFKLFHNRKLKDLQIKLEEKAEFNFEIDRSPLSWYTTYNNKENLKLCN